MIPHSEPSRAQDEYPNKPIKLIVPWPAGSNSGTWARLIAEPLGKQLRQPILIDHRPGATGTIGASAVAKAKPDGYTLLYALTVDQAVAPHVLRSLNYDPVSAFAPVALMLEAPVVLVVHPSLQAATLNDLVALAKGKPGELIFGTPGMGSIGHLYWEMLMQRTGIRLTHVPYKGQAELLPDLLEGRIHLSYLWPNMALQHKKARKLNVMMTTSAARSPDFPDVPTAKEAGFPEFTLAVWAGLLAPAGTPLEIVRMLNDAVKKILADPALRSALERTDAQARTSTPEEFAELIRTDRERWGRVVKAANIQQE